MIIPIPITSSPSTCPKCGNIENKKEICGHCNYEYSDSDEFSIKEIFIIICILFFMILGCCWFVITIMEWITDINNRSLVEMLKAQWDFIKNLRIW